MIALLQRTQKCSPNESMLIRADNNLRYTAHAIELWKTLVSEEIARNTVSTLHLRGPVVVT